ncbi:MAG: ferredoxin [Frankiales bacterium]|nr:ferredoxin [Frankiales bacterium]
MTASSTAITTVYTEHVSELEVVSRTDVADGVISLLLAAPDGGELPAWTPGAHVDLLLTPELTRQYSLCGSPSDRSSWRIGVLLDPASRGGSRHVHEALAPRSRLSVRGPRNNFPLVGAPTYVFVAGGIGITPLLPMIAEADAAGAQWTLSYGGRTRASMGFLDELAAYGDRVVVWPEDERGMLDLDGILGRPQPDALVYTCGPEGLLQAVEGRCAAWPAGSLHVERFSAKPVDSAAVSTSFEVICQRSGITVTVPEDRSILEVVQDAGVPALSSCLEGVCGTCETAVVEGEPDHRDSLLSEDEKAAGDFMMICVSRANGPRLVLDL